MESTRASGRRGRPVTRDVEPTALPDLLERAPRATVAFVGDGRVDILPARARREGEGYRFGVAAEPAVDLDGREVVLVLDDGPYWFELRGISVRGVARRLPASGSLGAAPLAWYAVEPRRVLAWDYGALRET